MKLWKEKRSGTMRNSIICFFTTLLLSAIVLLILLVGVYVNHVNRSSIRPFMQQKLEIVQLNASILNSELDRSVNTTLLSPSFQEELFRKNRNTLRIERTYSAALLDILLQDLNIMSAAVFEMSGKVHIERGTEHLYAFNSQELFGQRWQQAIQNAKGEFAYFMNGDGVVKFTNSDQHFISFVRELQRLTDYSCFGYVVINITQKQLERVLFNSAADEDCSLVICTPDGEIIASSGKPVAEEKLLYCLQQEDFFFREEREKNMAWSKAAVGYADWMAVCVNPVNIAENTLEYMILFAVVVGIILIIIVYSGQIFMADRISKPLEKLVAHMNLVKNGEFKEIMVEETMRFDEIRNLYVIYNQMLLSINQLIQRVEEESAFKRKSEIALLQEQIKPHYLYNALDAVSALSLIGDSETAYRLTQALGGFYRTSLSSGQDLVSVATEIECIQNYTTVLNIRYNNKLKMTYFVPKYMVEYKILRLILQPLVENAVYHGVRLRVGVGHIEIRAELLEEDMILSVQDDGVGMTPETIQAVLGGMSRTVSRGFGVYGLIEKLRLFYRTEKPLQIESQVGKGTRVTIRVPAMKGECGG